MGGVGEGGSSGLGRGYRNSIVRGVWKLMIVMLDYIVVVRSSDVDMGYEWRNKMMLVFVRGIH